MLGGLIPVQLEPLWLLKQLDGLCVGQLGVGGVIGVLGLKQLGVKPVGLNLGLFVIHLLNLIGLRFVIFLQDHPGGASFGSFITLECH